MVYSIRNSNLDKEFDKLDNSVNINLKVLKKLRIQKIQRDMVKNYQVIFQDYIDLE